VADELPDPRAIGDVPRHHVAGTVEQTVAPGGDERAAVAGIVGGDHPAAEVGQPPRVLRRGERGGRQHEGDRAKLVAESHAVGDFGAKG
jgi:hypothetical protein